MGRTLLSAKSLEHQQISGSELIFSRTKVSAPHSEQGTESSFLWPLNSAEWISSHSIRLLSDDERLVRDTARKFIEDNLIPIIEECNRAGRFPRELVKPMGDLGFFGASLKGYGCAGMSNVEYGLVTQELERGDSGVRSFVSVQSALVMYPIYAFGSDEQKQTWLPAMQKGEKLGCFGLTEPDFGSNPGGMRTRARKVGNEYVLNGEKMWITSGSIADVAVIWAKTDDSKDPNDASSIRGFLVETDRPGFRAEDIHGKWSLRASVTSSLVAAGCPHACVEPAAENPAG